MLSPQHSEPTRRRVRAATGVFLIGLGLSWVLSNIGQRGPHLATIWAGNRFDLGIDLLDPLGLIPLIVGAAMLVRRDLAAFTRATVGTLLMSIGIGWICRSARIPTVWPGHDLRLYDVLALALGVLGASMLLRLGLSERLSRAR